MPETSLDTITVGSEEMQTLSHADVVARTVDVEVLARSESRLGALKIDSIDDGQIVPMGTLVGLEADFENIDALSMVTPENFNSFQDVVGSEPKFERFRAKLTGMTPEQQGLELQLYFVTGLALDYFGREKLGSMDAATVEERKTQRDTTYGDYALDQSRKDSLEIKPLSKTGPEALCTEYAVFTKEALRRLGTNLSYVAADKQYWNDDPSFYHSFLVSVDGKIIVDPLDTAQYYAKNLPWGVRELTDSLYDSHTPLEAKEVWGDRTTTYSLNPISG